MPKQLNVEDLLTILEFTKHHKATEIRARLERLTQDAADLVATDTATIMGIATWEGKEFGGCCVAFHASTEDQKLPESFEETLADPSGDWETEDGIPVPEK